VEQEIVEWLLLKNFIINMATKTTPVVNKPAPAPVATKTTPPAPSGPTSIYYNGTYINPAYASADAKAKGTVVKTNVAGGAPDTPAYIPRAPIDTNKGNGTDGGIGTSDKTFSEVVEAAYAKLLGQSAGYLGAINEKYNLERKNQEQIGIENKANVRGSLAASGMGGSGEAARMSNDTAQYTADQIAKVEADRTTEIGGVISTIQQNAASMAQAEISSDRTLQANIKTDATNAISALGSAHTDLEKFKTENPEAYSHLVDVFGSSNVVDAMYANSIPKQNILNTNIKGSTAMVISQDPVTGAVHANTYDLGIEVPRNWTMEKTPDGTMAIMKAENFDPNDPSTFQIWGVDDNGLFTKLVSGDPNEASINRDTSLSSFASAITNQEGADYTKVNPDSGALGKYQIMPFNLGYAGLTNDEAGKQAFLNSPELQDKAFNKMIQESYNKYSGDFNKMAADYYGGELGAKNYGTPQGDVQGKIDPKTGKPTGYPSVNEYVDQVNKKIGSQTQDGKDYAQVGLLANTSYNPKNKVDSNAKNYIERYLKNNKYPTAYELGLGRSTNAVTQDKFRQIQARADDLYYEATGTSMPSVADLTGTWKIINQNKGILNKINIASDTVESNFNLAIRGEISNDVNQNATAVNKLLNPIYLALGDPAVNQALVSNGTITQEFANLISTRNAQGTLAADKMLAEELLPFGTSVEAQKAVVSRLVQEAVNIKKALTSQQETLYQQVDPLQQNPNNPARKTSDKKTDVGDNGGQVITAPDGTQIIITD